MSLVTTLTSKGQVTVPKEIRDALGLKPCDKVEIFVKDGQVWLRKADPPLREDGAGSSRREGDVDEQGAARRDASCKG